MHISILDFLKTGEFGSIKLGMSREEVVAILGKPTYWFPNTGDDFTRADTWDYYWVSLSFPPQRIEFVPEGLYSIWMARFYNINGIEVTWNYTLDTWALSYQHDIDFVAQRLSDAGLTYTKNNHFETVEKSITLQLVSGVELHFHRNYDEEQYPERFYFRSVGIQRPTTIKNPTKQVSITVPLPLYAKLQRISKKHRQSISAICGELLIPILSRLPDAEDV